jgi:hypothetical protein
MKLRRFLSLTIIPMILLGSVLNILAEESEGPTATSPDKKYVFRKLRGDEKGTPPENQDGPVAFSVVDNNSNTCVAIEAGGCLNPIENATACIWSADSKHFAVNSRCGGRYEVTELYAFDGKKFKLLASFEEMIAEKLEAARAAELKKAKVPADTYLRRIWDTYKTLKWIDASTVEVYGMSGRAFMVNKETEEMDGVEVEFIFTITYDKKGKPHITDQRKAPAKEN